MRGFYRTNSWGMSRFGGGMLPPGIRLLIFANGAVFLLQMAAYTPILASFGLSPAKVANGAIWQLFTYMFLHGGFFHILFNMFVLWMFGQDLEREWGTRAFVKYYLICGIGAGVVTQIALWGQTIPTIGASGAVFGILLAFGMAYPNRYIYLWFLFPVKAKYLVIGIGLLELMSSINYTTDGIGHFTHLGGLAVGFLYLKRGRRGLSLPRPFAWMGRMRARRKGRNLRKQWDEQRNLMEEVDRVLDRINEVGYDHLTDEEKRTLEKASRKLSTKSDQR